MLSWCCTLPSCQGHQSRVMSRVSCWIVDTALPEIPRTCGTGQETGTDFQTMLRGYRFLFYLCFRRGASAVKVRKEMNRCPDADTHQRHPERDNHVGGKLWFIPESSLCLRLQPWRKLAGVMRPDVALDNLFLFTVPIVLLNIDDYISGSPGCCFEMFSALKGKIQAISQQSFGTACCSDESVQHPVATPRIAWKRRAHVPWLACQQPMRALAAARAILQSSQLDRGQDLSRKCHMFGECKNHRIANPFSFSKSRLANYKCKSVKMSFFQKHVVLTLFRNQQSQTWTKTINQLMKSQ